MSGDRYIPMSCCTCPADWIEDGVEPGPTCPSCGHLEPWPLVDKCPRLHVVDEPREFLYGWEVQRFLAGCSFVRKPMALAPRGREHARWVWQHKDGKLTWRIELAVVAYEDVGIVSSAFLTYFVNGKRALYFNIRAMDDLTQSLYVIIGSIGRISQSPLPPTDGLFCGQEVVE